MALSLLGGDVGGAARKFAYFAYSLALILTITAGYHLASSMFRRDGIGPPEIGNTVISVPMLLTTNPVGSVLAHASMHVAAVAHAYETPAFLPPQVRKNGQRAVSTPSSLISVCVRLMVAVASELPSGAARAGLSGSNRSAFRLPIGLRDAKGSGIGSCRSRFH